jgi:hypothetical protein
MAKVTKERVQQLASDVRRANSEAALAIKELLVLLISEAKDNLVHSPAGTDTVRTQGEAQAFIRLHSMVTKEPPSIKRAGE